jgi:hypothetical protein
MYDPASRNGKNAWRVLSSAGRRVVTRLETIHLHVVSLTSRPQQKCVDPCFLFYLLPFAPKGCMTSICLQKMVFNNPA